MPSAANFGTFVKDVDGKQVERVAHSAAQAVKFRFDGWREKPATRPAKTTPARGGSAADSPNT